jgi:hypothetical protein
VRLTIERVEMIAINDGREIRLQIGRDWQIEEGYLVLSLVEAKQLRGMLDFDKREIFESEPEDG